MRSKFGFSLDQYEGLNPTTGRKENKKPEVYFEGILIDHKAHGLGKLLVKAETVLRAYLYGSFRDGLPDGPFIYISEDTSDKFILRRFAKGVEIMEGKPISLK